MITRELTKAQKSVIGYWFAREPVLPNRDGRAVVIGQTLAVNPPLYLCHRGLHGSEHPFDALQYATGPLLYRCRFSGEIIHGPDKLCASERTALAMVDLTPQLRLFARQQALSVIHLWDAPAVVRRYLETGEESLRNAAGTAAGTVAAAAGSVAARAVVAAARDASAAHWAAAEAASAEVSTDARATARAAFMRTVEDAFAGHDRPGKGVQ